MPSDPSISLSSVKFSLKKSSGAPGERVRIMCQAAFQYAFGSADERNAMFLLDSIGPGVNAST
jgi:hypothetical protein